VFIAVIPDLYKTGLGVKRAGAEQVFQRSLEGIMAAVNDAGIAMATLMTAARAFGLGVVPIGGIRRDPQAMIDLLGFSGDLLKLTTVELCLAEIPIGCRIRRIDCLREAQVYGHGFGSNVPLG
jgi:nitroreductase